MTIMDNTNPNCFWAYIGGERAGIKHPVKNLGWIIAHKNDIESLHVAKSLGSGAHFQARLFSDGTRAMEDSRRMYYARFESFETAKAFMMHKRFNHVVSRTVAKGE